MAKRINFNQSFYEEYPYKISEQIRNLLDAKYGDHTADLEGVAEILAGATYSEEVKNNPWLTIRTHYQGSLDYLKENALDTLIEIVTTPLIRIEGDVEAVYRCDYLNGYTTLTACAKLCPKYSSCYAVAEANDTFLEAEEQGLL